MRLSRASIAAASACTAAGEPSESCSRASSSSASGLATATRPLPVRLASSSARSAAASSSSAPIGGSQAAMPIEQLPPGPCGERGEPARTRWCTRSATARAACSSVPGSTSTNSSPP